MIIFLGASSDLKQATSIAAHMVRDWGMSEKVGLRTFESNKGAFANENLGQTTIESVRTTIKFILLNKLLKVIFITSLRSTVKSRKY